jgi:hypothetical protein
MLRKHIPALLHMASFLIFGWIIFVTKVLGNIDKLDHAYWVDFIKQFMPYVWNLHCVPILFA